jgi:hypothetical protein
MARQRGLEYTIKVEDKFSASLTSLNGQLGTVAANVRALGSAMGRLPITGGPVQQVKLLLDSFKGNRADLRGAARDMGRLAVVFREFGRNAGTATTKLKQFVTQLNAMRAAVRGMGPIVDPKTPKVVADTNKELKKTDSFFDRIARVGVRVLGIFLLFQAAKGAIRGRWISCVRLSSSTAKSSSPCSACAH